MSEMKNPSNLGRARVLQNEPRVFSKSVDDSNSILSREPGVFLPRIPNPEMRKNETDTENRMLREDLELMMRSSADKFKPKSPRRVNEIKGINYNYVNRNKKDEVKNLLFVDKSYQNPMDQVYADFDNPLKINKKDYFEVVNSPKPTISSLPLTKNDISSYEVLKKKMVNYIHFNIHKGSLDEKVAEKVNKIRECEEKKFRISKLIGDPKEKDRFARALERRILVLFDEGRKKRLVQLLNNELYYK